MGPEKGQMKIDIAVHVLRGGGGGGIVYEKWPDHMSPIVMGRAPTQSPWGFVRVS